MAHSVGTTTQARSVSGGPHLVAAIPPFIPVALPPRSRVPEGLYPSFGKWRSVFCVAALHRIMQDQSVLSTPWPTDLDPARVPFSTRVEKHPPPHRLLGQAHTPRPPHGRRIPSVHSHRLRVTRRLPSHKERSNRVARGTEPGTARRSQETMGNRSGDGMGASPTCCPKRKQRSLRSRVAATTITSGTCTATCGSCVNGLIGSRP